MGKVLKRHLLIRIVPMLAMVLLLCGLMQINQVQEYSYLLYQMNTINERTLIIFLGTLLFGVLSIFNTVLVIKKIHLIKSWWLRYYLVTVACSLLLIVFIFFQAGWIGLRPWA
jgi:hypothetical protein